MPAVAGARRLQASNHLAFGIDPGNRISECGHGDQELPVPGEVVWVGETRNREPRVEPLWPIEQDLPRTGRLGRIESGAGGAAPGTREPGCREAVDLLDPAPAEQHQALIQARDRDVHRAILTNCASVTIS
jgi:hypothetical protein